MASRVEFAVSATPIYTATNAEMNNTDVIAKDVGHTVGGSGSVTVTWGSTGGYSGGMPSAYLEVGFGSHSFGPCKFLYLRHTGYTLVGGDGATVLGVPTTDTVVLNAGGTPIAVLGAGQAMIFPCQVAQTIALTYSSTLGGSIALEYFWTA